MSPTKTTCSGSSPRTWRAWAGPAVLGPDVGSLRQAADLDRRSRPLRVWRRCSAGLAGSFHALLAWRFVHGLAAASAVVTRSVIRDLYSGRHMARVMSLTFMVFLTVPILAPSIGQLILLAAPWRYIFIVCGIFARCVCAWAHAAAARDSAPGISSDADPFATSRARFGWWSVNRSSLCYTLAMSVMFGGIMAYVGMVQQIFGEVFHRASLMPAMFALCATTMGVAAFLNSQIVERLGMRRISHTALADLHRHHGPAFADRGARAGAAVDFRRVSVRDHGVLCAVDFQFRRHGDGAGRRRSRASARRCRDSSRRWAARWSAP